MRRIAFVLTLSTTSAFADPAAQQIPTPAAVDAPAPAAPVPSSSSTSPTMTAPPAPPPTEDQLKAAATQAKAGKQLLKKKDFVGARTLLESAYSVSPTPDTLLDLVQTYRGLEKNALALQTIVNARATSTATLQPAQVSAIETHVSELTPLTYRLFLVLPASVKTLRLDNVTVPVPPSGAPLVLEPGLHALQIEQSGFEAYTKDVNAVAGQEVSVNVELEPYVTTGHVRIADKANQALSLTIDGQEVGVTPWEGDLPEGPHTIQGKSQRASAAPVTVDVPRRGAVDVVLDSVVKYERVLIASPTPGAMAYLDGQLVQLPFDEYLLLGEHQLRVTAPHHSPVERTLNVLANQPLSEQIVLTAARADELTLEREKEPVPFRVGLLLGVVSLPRPINAELSLKPNAFFGLGAGFSMIPKVEVDNISARMHAFNVVGRIFPFQGAFYFGLGAGQQFVTVDSTDEVEGQTLTGSVDHSSFFLTPQLGWLWMWDSGIALGLNIGVQVPISATPTVTVRGPDGNELDPELIGERAVELRDSVSDAAKWLGKLPLPAVDLLKVGFFF